MPCRLMAGHYSLEVGIFVRVEAWQPKKCAYDVSVSIPAFQAGWVGQSPATRTIIPCRLAGRTHPFGGCNERS